MGKMWTEFDYCVGSDLVMINLVYNIMLNIVSGRNKQGIDPFKDLPIQDVKPMKNDPTCLSKLFDLSRTYGDAEPGFPIGISQRPFLR